ncbi:U3 small nucleolar RNA-associated protein 6 homolog [Neltuma alba]|uniref:U3 small nucleolar RNA-associated protein 6 homolog n=1 Tax=Neltuma alba TaxID=207710 RepID=UPI0010A32ADC|nr:U3 small nucleolar RNA-associated protein 6 homolog [Prosopis alba]XP_028759379.1 U3 small nucleolar RNA-associated protein 6 homolog [Prosopis alba]
MADVVQYRLERMVDELDDLEQRGIFSRREIAEIVKQRRKFEYRLKRPSPLKQDFLAYIDYETQLDSLRRLRKKLVVSHESENQGNEKKKKKKKSKSDFAGVLRIMDIYELVLKRYKGDIDIWFRYLEFCRLKKNGRMKKALAKLVRFHPKVPGVWIYAAAWEFDHNLNVAAARALMQEGLRVCPTSEDLWIEYLRMELTYLNKLKARKVALGEDEGTLTRDQSDAYGKQQREENEDSFLSFSVKPENNENSNVEDGDSEKKQALFAERGMSIFQTIYSGAVEAVPSSLNLRQRFLEILEGTKLANSEEMRDEILNGMKRDFLTEPEFWDWLARREYNPETVHEMSEEAIISHLQRAIEVYEEALRSVPSGNMFRLYANCLMSFMAHKGGETTISELSDEAVNYVSHLLRIYERAESMACLTEDLACDYLSFYLQLGRLDEARKLSTKLCSGKLAESVQLWVLRITIEIKCIAGSSPSLSDADLLSLFELFRCSLRRFPVSKSENLWLMALKFYANQRPYFNKLLEISVTTLARDGGSENGFSLSSAIVKFILQKDGIQQTRETYKRFLALPHPGLVLYKNCIDLETNLASIGDKDGLMNARKLYESALATYDQDVKLWQDYYQMESKMGTSEKATAVVWRARRILKDAGVFIASPNLG